jgi:hypothetical protein
LGILIDCIRSVYRYNISLKDYFYFRFYQKSHEERNEWAGTGFMYQYQLKMNPKSSRYVLEDKNQFLGRFKQYVKRVHGSISDLKREADLVDNLLSNPSGRLVLKGSHGQVGREVEIIKCKEYSSSSLLQYMDKKGYDLAEEYVIQHPDIMALSPTGLNTVRIFTQLKNDKVEFLGARFRVSVNSPVDNMGAGNLAAPVDMETGIVSGPGVYSDITKTDKAIHPITGNKIEGFQLPHWPKIKDLSINAAKVVPENKSIGWDIAVTSEGPELIEGNHNWCKLLWQLPVKKGMKTLLINED